MDRGRLLKSVDVCPRLPFRFTPSGGIVGRTVLVGGAIKLPPKYAAVGFGVLAVFMVGVMMAFATGQVQTLGYESRSLSGDGLTSMKAGHSLGLKTFYFFKNQEFFADYDTDIRKGALTIHLVQFGRLPSGNSPYHQKIRQSEKGTVRFRIQESGLYHIGFRGSVLGGQSRTGSYDLSYQIRWGIR
jgi:hypothetical protein